MQLAKAMKPTKQSGRAYHVTFICKKRKVVAIGFNDFHRRHPARKWGEYNPTKNIDAEYEPCLHSEISAIIKCGQEDCSQYDFFNIRINNNGKIAPSKPCENCQRVLNQIGYNKVYYFDEEMNLKTL